MPHQTRTSSDREITNHTAAQLAGLIGRGELTASEVVEAHIRRIEQVNGKLNAVVVPLFDQARQEARTVDEARQRGDSLGPLAGVPITVKEVFDVAGTPTTAGLTARRYHRAEKDATVVARLRSAGAIVLGKTNVSQLAMMPDTDNPLYGCTNNPWNLDRSPGGSSGGESAIIAAGGSPLGLGSDAGGSVRQPAHSCGICCIKPTGHRLPLDGHFSSANWYESWPQPGPMARSVEDLELALWVMSTGSDAATGPRVAAPPLENSRRVDTGALRVGVYTELGGIRPAPALRRAVDEAADALRAAGAAVEEFTPPDAEQAWDLYSALFYADGLADMRRQCQGSDLDRRVSELFRYSRLPGWVREPLATLFELRQQTSKARVLRTISRPVLAAHEFVELVRRQDAYQRQFAAALDAVGLDAIIAPPSPLPAFTHGELYTMSTMLYTGLYNLLGVPAGVVPATRVHAGEESDRADAKDYVVRCCRRVESGSAGLPVGVQVVARWWREDVVLAVMRVLEEHFRGSEAFPNTPTP